MFRDFAQLEGAGTPFNWTEAIGFGRQPFISFQSGAFECSAGPNGVAIGAFGWIDPKSGEVSNTVIAGAFMGIVLPLAYSYNQWERAYIQPGPPFPQMIIRPGIACTVATVGTFSMKFPDGGQAGMQVCADPATGLPYSGNRGTDIATRWTLCRSGEAGARLRISSLVKPFNA